ncbi:uncharacterized protein LOC133198071 [Saccostrea echinata]|uniref:uncharacterized protein LOC133198071 n=1 Tax=Saccostrea echinata TaxID=191078 RepID=UPI002A7FEEC0|nr:uncharacterized protein LOC133198071 [Saccostrea echinata]
MAGITSGRHHIRCWGAELGCGAMLGAHWAYLKVNELVANSHSDIGHALSSADVCITGKGIEVLLKHSKTDQKDDIHAGSGSVWIVGSSIIKRAFIEARSSDEGAKLGLGRINLNNCSQGSSANSSLTNAAMADSANEQDIWWKECCFFSQLPHGCIKYGYQCILQKLSAYESLTFCHHLYGYQLNICSQGSSANSSLTNAAMADSANEQRERLENKDETRIRNEDKIDKQNISPEDPDQRLLYSMGVGINGQIQHPQGLHPEKSEKFKEQKLDKTVETKEESEKEGGSGKEKRRKRNFGPSWQNWPKGIVPFIFDDNLRANRKPFQDAIALFNELTCIRWKPRSPEVTQEVGHQAYVRVQSGSGCSSGVGFYGKGELVITLAEPGCGSVSTSVHEMLHRLGQRHEQSRSDRDRYVRIVWKNINPDNKFNFYRRLTYNRNPYDVGSVMQYGYTSFGGGKTTIELRDKNLLFLEVPSHQIFSFYDLKDVLDQYKCTDHCSPPPDCYNGGYINVTCGCNCPEGFTGATCDTVITDSDCGGFVYLKENDVVLDQSKDVSVTSPNYPGPVGQGKICRWAIKAPEGFIIKMTIDDLHLAYNPKTVRCYHWLEIQYNLPGQPGIRRCGDIVGETFLTSKDSPTLMIVTMDTKFAGSRVTHKGFKLHFEKEKEVCRDNPCLYGVCVPSELKACQYKCVCQPGYTGDNCDQVLDDAKLKCTFERFEKCFFSNTQEGDNFEWGVGFRHSISLGTGPESVYRGERFLFAEMSSPRKPGDRAVIVTVVTLPDKAGCLTFAYNMFGRNVKKLTLFSEGRNAAKTSLWSKEGNQGSDWLTANVNIPAKEGIKLSFEAIAGDAWDSDVALDEIKWEVGQCDKTVTKDCIESGKEYEGTRAYTKNGVKCQAWASNEPYAVPSKYAYLATESNYCRIADEPEPWCYTTSTTTRWDWCDVPYCSATECAYTPNQVDYSGTVSYTKTGIPCQRWDSQTPHTHSYNDLMKDENYCRNTDDSAGAWCYTQDPDTRWELCDVPQCEKIERDCLMTGRGIDYAGRLSTTTSGKTCLPWQEESMREDANYCRNPDLSSKPWCYVKGETGPIKEYCEIKSCADSPCFPNPCKNGGQCEVNGTKFSCTCLEGFKGDNCETQELQEEADCKRTKIGWEYQGNINVTKSGRKCQAWGSNFPHTSRYTDLPVNYCRNPGIDDAPWCYTTDPEKIWEYCDIPDCATTALECLINSDPKGRLYFGTHNVANTGDLCQAWGSQSPNTHRYTYLSDQSNYCRNPDGEPAPWCYTVNPKVRWSICIIPHC